MSIEKERQLAHSAIGASDSALLPGLREALKWKPNTPQLENAMTYAWEAAIKSFVRALEAAAPAPAQEPVAWISYNVLTKSERIERLPVQSLQPGVYKHTPLYAAPLAVAGVRRIEFGPCKQCLNPANCHALGYCRQHCWPDVNSRPTAEHKNG